MIEEPERTAASGVVQVYVAPDTTFVIVSIRLLPAQIGFGVAVNVGATGCGLITTVT